MTRAELTEKILVVKRRKRLTWRGIAAKLGPASVVYYTAALLGQTQLDKSEAEAAGKIFGLGEDEVLLLQEPAYRGCLPTAIPTDPLVYRFYEILATYGTTFKALIHEEFGEGIMSAIDFDVQIERQPDKKGDRVRMTLSGKFLAYKKF
ncbi:MAG TPA: cyanase [Usitatibacter sp.]|nr:cyanase [Usitatibacter sp.]